MASKASAEPFSVSWFRCNEDNYAYLVVDNSSGKAALIDAGEKKVDNLIGQIKKQGIELSSLSYIFSTHKHADHSDGNAGFLEAIEGLKIVGPKIDNVPSANVPVSDGDEIVVGNLVFRCIHTPCHTKGSMCYLVSPASSKPEDSPFSASSKLPAVLFTGDTLFIGGCGRFFEGTGEDMYNALLKKISALPDRIRLYTGHEYTVNNLLFGLAVEPDNEHMKSKLEWARKQVDEGKWTQGSTIGEEKQINVFMRVHEQTVQESVKISDPVKLMDELRTMKNSFKPSSAAASSVANKL